MHLEMKSYSLIGRFMGENLLICTTQLMFDRNCLRLTITTTNLSVYSKLNYHWYLWKSNRDCIWLDGTRIQKAGKWINLHLRVQVHRCEPTMRASSGHFVKEHCFPINAGSCMTGCRSKIRSIRSWIYESFNFSSLPLMNLVVRATMSVAVKVHWWEPAMHMEDICLQNGKVIWWGW